MARTTMAAAEIFTPVSFSSLGGWMADDHGTALEAFRRSCAEIESEGRAFDRPITYGGARADWLDVCARAETARNARGFFEENFAALAVTDPSRPEGLFTGYFEPEAAGSLKPAGEYRVPIYRKPPELVGFDRETERTAGFRYGRLVDGEPDPFPARKDIEQGALQGRGLEIVWLKDWADAFFIHIQGSGRIRLPDGKLLRLAYAGKNGRPYTGIGPLLVERGVFTREEMSMQSTRVWMAQHPEDARKLMWENQSFIFFREVPIDDPALGPPGAQKVSLTPLRSLAVDRSLWAFGTPVYLETTTPSGPGGAMELFRHLMIAQDTGTAIRGYARGDVFWGAGDRAALAAGHMKSPGRITVLLPKPLAAKLLDRR